MANQEVSQLNTGRHFFYGYILVAVAFVIMLLGYGTRHTFGVFFKPVLTEFGWTRALTSGAFTFSVVVQGILGIFMGRLNDRVGPRLVMTFCCICLGLGYLLMSRIGSGWQLYLYYGIVVGIGMSGIFVALLSTVARWFVKRRGMMTGIVTAGLGAGSLVMLPLSSWLISVYDWRLSYAILGSVVLVIGVSASLFLKRDPTRMGLIPYGQSEVTGQRLAPSAEGLSFREAANTGQFWLVMLIYFCLGYNAFTIIVHLVPHITDLGISAATAASILAVRGGVGTVSVIMWGGAIDRIGSRWVIAISFMVTIVAMLGLVTVKEAWMFYLLVIVVGLGAGGAGPAESTIVAELFGMKSHGAILGFISFIFTIGSAVGPFVTGYIFDVTDGYRVAFLLCAGLGVIGFILSAILRPIKRPGLE